MRSISRLLFVAEGRFHPHKLLGLYAICHFAYRYQAFFAGELSTDMGFANGRPHRTALLLAPHLALQLSGLRFTIPRRRVAEGSRIWPEYRWHALVFACRSLALMALALMRDTSDAPAEAARLLPPWVPPLLVVLLTMAAADAVSRVHARRGEACRTICSPWHVAPSPRENRWHMRCLRPCLQSCSRAHAHAPCHARTVHVHTPGESSRTIRDLAAPRGVQYLMCATLYSTHVRHPEPMPEPMPGPMPEPMPKPQPQPHPKPNEGIQYLM